MFSRIFLSAVILVVIQSSLYFGLKLYRHRLRMSKLRNAGVPMPKSWSWLYGHILYIYRITNTQLPPYSNINNMWPVIAADFGDTEMFLIDLWPFMDPMVIVFNLEAVVSIAQKQNLQKGRGLERMMRPITGGPSMLSMNNHEWKLWRNLFNPCFSNAAMTEQIPNIVDSVAVFSDKLREGIGKGIIFLDDLTSRLTFEVILKVILDKDADHQQSDHLLGRALGKIIQWHSFHDPIIRLNPVRLILQGYYSRVISKYIQGELDARLKEIQQNCSRKVEGAVKAPKSAVSIAIKGFISDRTATGNDKLDEGFSKMVTYQTRLFLLAGNDTTSSSMVFVYHLLSKHPEVLKSLRAEHDEVFGEDPSDAASKIKEQPFVIHNCNYTLAVIKETLRLFPPASSLRDGTGAQLTTRNGFAFPTDGCSIILSHITMHRSPRLFPQPEAFLPERWLVGSEHYLYPTKNAYRPFELGPRNCIGQTLSINEMKVVLIMTARSFDIEPGYGEFDAQRERSMGALKRWKKAVGFIDNRKRTLNGDRAFQTEKAGAHPSDRYPCRVSLRGTVMEA